MPGARHQRDVAGVGLAVEHALGHERAAERDAVEPADQPLARATPPSCARSRARAAAGTRAGSGREIHTPSSASRGRAQARMTSVARRVDPQLEPPLPQDAPQRARRCGCRRAAGSRAGRGRTSARARRRPGLVVHREPARRVGAQQLLGLQVGRQVRLVGARWDDPRPAGERSTAYAAFARLARTSAGRRASACPTRCRSRRARRRSRGWPLRSTATARQPLRLRRPAGLAAVRAGVGAQHLVVVLVDLGARRRLPRDADAPRLHGAREGRVLERRPQQQRPGRGPSRCS